MREVKHPDAGRRTHTVKYIALIYHNAILSTWTPPIKRNASFNKLPPYFFRRALRRKISIRTPWIVMRLA
jgi:hypothetical protein